MERRQLTPEGYNKIEREISRIEQVDIPRVVERLREIREDNVGNEEDPELNETMEQKKRLEERVAQLKQVLALAEIVETSDPNRVNIGDRVVLLDMEEDEEMTLALVDGVELGGDRRGIAANSPVGKALLGQEVGTEVKVKVPDGVIRYKILAIESDLA